MQNDGYWSTRKLFDTSWMLLAINYGTLYGYMVHTQAGTSDADKKKYNKDNAKIFFHICSETSC